MNFQENHPKYMIKIGYITHILHDSFSSFNQENVMEKYSQYFKYFFTFILSLGIIYLPFMNHFLKTALLTPRNEKVSNSFFSINDV